MPTLPLQLRRAGNILSYVLLGVLLIAVLRGGNFSQLWVLFVIAIVLRFMCFNWDALRASGKAVDRLEAVSEVPNPTPKEVKAYRRKNPGKTTAEAIAELKEQRLREANPGIAAK